MIDLITVDKELDIYDYTDRKLRAHTQNNEEFNREFATLLEFYKEKLAAIVSDSDQERLERDLFQSIKAQVFNGYFMSSEIINSPESVISDEWLKQSEGMMAQQLPEMLKSATGEAGLENVITNEPLKALTSWLVIAYEGVYPILMDISLNTACMGAKRAFLDEAEKRGIQSYSPQHKGLVGTIDDVDFINPQNYISCTIVNESSEVWDVIETKHTGLDRVGIVTAIKIMSDEDKDKFYVNINVKSNLPIKNQQNIIDSIALRIMSLNDLQRDQLLLSAASVEEFYEIG